MATLSPAVAVDQIRVAFHKLEKVSANHALWIREIHLEPNELIVQNDDEGSMYRVPFTAAAGKVHFDVWQPVKAEYVAAASRVQACAAHFDSRDESRSAPTAAGDSSGAEATYDPRWLSKAERDRLAAAHDRPAPTATPQAATPAAPPQAAAPQAPPATGGIAAGVAYPAEWLSSLEAERLSIIANGGRIYSALDGDS